MEVLDGFAKLHCLIDIQQMVSMFIETSNSLRCQPPSEGEYQIVVRQRSLYLTMRDGHFSFERIDVGNFGFNEVHSSIQHPLPQVERNIVSVALAKSQAYQRWIKNKVTTSRDKRNLMF